MCLREREGGTQHGNENEWRDDTGARRKRSRGANRWMVMVGDRHDDGDGARDRWGGAGERWDDQTDFFYAAQTQNTRSWRLLFVSNHEKYKPMTQCSPVISSGLSSAAC